MRGVLLLAYRRVRTSLVQTLALALCVALSIAVPLSTNVVADEYERDLRARAGATPLVAGASGSRFDLVFSSLYFRRSDLEPVPYSLYLGLQQDQYVDAIPVHQRFTAQRWPVVGTSTEYFEFRGLSPAAGTIPLMLGDALLGNTVAQELGLGVGDTVFSRTKNNVGRSHCRTTVVGKDFSSCDRCGHIDRHGSFSGARRPFKQRDSSQWTSSTPDPRSHFLHYVLQ